MHPNYAKAEHLSREVIGAGIEVHRILGAGLLESIYERCLMRELELREFHAVNQKTAQLDYKGVSFEEMLRVDVLVEDALLIEIKAVQEVHPIHKAQLLSYMKIMDIPLGLIMNFHSIRLVDGLSRMILPGADSSKVR